MAKNSGAKMTEVEILDGVFGVDLLVSGAGEHHAGHEGSQHGLHPEGLGDHAEGQHRGQGHGQGTPHVVAFASHEPECGINQPLPDRERTDHEDRQPADGGQHVDRRHVAGCGQAGDHPEDHPANEIVGHPGGDRDLADVAAHQVQVTQDLGDHRQGRHGHRGGDEQREHDAIWAGALDGAVEDHRHQPARNQPTDERNDNAARRDQRRRPTETRDQGQIGFEPGDHEEEGRTEPRHRQQHGRLGRGVLVGRKEPVEQSRGGNTENARTEDQAG